MRPSFTEIYLNMAVLISKRSTCKRLQVGSIIVSEDFTKILSLGYNGNAKGFNNTCDRDVPGDCGCLHSEINALLKLDFSFPNKIMFVTHLPCTNCSKAIINCDIKKIFYIKDYRIKDSLLMFERANIEVERVELKKIDISNFF